MEALSTFNFPDADSGIRTAGSQQVPRILVSGPGNSPDCVCVPFESFHLRKVLTFPNPKMVREPYFTMEPAADANKEPVKSHSRQFTAVSCPCTSLMLESCSISQNRSLPFSSEVVKMTLFFQEIKDPGFESQLYCLTGAPFSSQSYVNSNLP